MNLTKEKIESEIARLTAEENALWEEFMRLEKELDTLQQPMHTARSRWAAGRNKIDALKAALALLEAETTVTTEAE